jgi:uncharacterized protein Yka (UPF0111/DUF47 family)
MKKIILSTILLAGFSSAFAATNEELTEATAKLIKNQRKIKNSLATKASSSELYRVKQKAYSNSSKIIDLEEEIDETKSDLEDKLASLDKEIENLPEKSQKLKEELEEIKNLLNKKLLIIKTSKVKKQPCYVDLNRTDLQTINNYINLK